MPHADILAQSGDGIANQFSHSHGRVSYEWLIHEAKPFGGSILIFGNIFFVHIFGAHGSYLHCQVVYKLLEAVRTGHEIGLAIHLYYGPHAIAIVDVCIYELAL